MQMLIRIDVYILSLSDVMLYLTNKFDRIYRKNICYGQSFNNSSSILMIIHLWDVINCYYDPNVIINPTIDTHVVDSSVSVQLLLSSPGIRLNKRTIRKLHSSLLFTIACHKHSIDHQNINGCTHKEYTTPYITQLKIRMINYIIDTLDRINQASIIECHWWLPQYYHTLAY